jgi:calmodulin
MTEKLSDTQIEELKEAFGLFDNNSGLIEIRELSNLLKTIGQNPSEDEIKIIIDQV